MKLSRLCLAFLLLLLIVILPSTALALTATVTWDPVTSYSDGVAIEAGKVVKYEVWRSQAADLSGAVRVNTSELTATTVTDSSISPNKTYYYYVVAYLIVGNSGPNSDTASFRTFPPGKTGKVVIVVTT